MTALCSNVVSVGTPNKIHRARPLLHVVRHAQQHSVRRLHVFTFVSLSRCLSRTLVSKVWSQVVALIMHPTSVCSSFLVSLNLSIVVRRFFRSHLFLRTKVHTPPPCTEAALGSSSIRRLWPFGQHSWFAFVERFASPAFRPSLLLTLSTKTTAMTRFVAPPLPYHATQ